MTKRHQVSATLTMRIGRYGCAPIALLIVLPTGVGEAMVPRQLPLTEQPFEYEPLSPFLSPTEPRPPPPPDVSLNLAASALAGLSVEARTRIIADIAVLPSRTLTVKLASGFRAGAIIVINPGGATEEVIAELAIEPHSIPARRQSLYLPSLLARLPSRSRSVSLLLSRSLALTLSVSLSRSRLSHALSLSHLETVRVLRSAWNTAADAAV